MIYEDDDVGIPIVANPSSTPRLLSCKSTDLAPTKKIVEFYGWTLTEQGTPGNGAKFIITIPTKQP